jgi:hypothetical protein
MAAALPHAAGLSPREWRHIETARCPARARAGAMRDSLFSEASASEPAPRAPSRDADADDGDSLLTSAQARPVNSVVSLIASRRSSPLMVLQVSTRVSVSPSLVSSHIAPLTSVASTLVKPFFSLT